MKPAPGELLCGATAVRTADRVWPRSSDVRKRKQGEALVRRLLLLSLPSPRAPLCLRTAGWSGHSKYVTAAWEAQIAAEPPAKTSCEGSSVRTHIPFQVGKSQLLQHFSSADRTDTFFFIPATVCPGRSSIYKELQSSSGVVNKRSSSASFHHRKNPTASMQTSLHTICVGWKSSLPGHSCADQTLGVYSWPFSVANAGTQRR